MPAVPLVVQKLEDYVARMKSKGKYKGKSKYNSRKIS